MKSIDVEIAVANYFDYRTNVIVPNVSWGMGLLYEADVVVLRPSNYAIEVEIKVSASDIRADLKKKHLHDSNLFKELWFAIPEMLKDNPNIPSHAGVLSIAENSRVSVIRKPIKRTDSLKWTQEQRNKLLHLASMRTWKLKQDTINLEKV